MSLLKKIWDEIEVKKPVKTGGLMLGLLAVSGAITQFVFDEAATTRSVHAINDMAQDKEKIEQIERARLYRDKCAEENIAAQLIRVNDGAQYKRTMQPNGLPVLHYNQNYKAPQTITPDLKAVSACFKHEAEGGYKFMNLMEKAYIGIDIALALGVAASAASFAAQRRRKNKGQDLDPAL